MHTVYDVTAALRALPDVFTAQTAMAAGISHHVLRRKESLSGARNARSAVFGEGTRAQLQSRRSHRCVPIRVSGPCPGCTTVSEGSVKSPARIEASIE